MATYLPSLSFNAYTVFDDINSTCHRFDRGSDAYRQFKTMVMSILRKITFCFFVILYFMNNDQGIPKRLLEREKQRRSITDDTVMGRK
ncbi:hypothetical protein LOZ86_14275 [Pectobacterium parvum]|uniref:Uncharacterized protein n=1 Tax=Pectobacterium parvum TaxID=2778550 RepID=A0AAP9LEJ9_9GAMM|nr:MULTISPECIES: hypothetical protein [Pectobacterium]MCU1801345.1 hypothetical protein [Pectobacterium parvum]QHQ26443.1 hypothetical protein GMX10_22260 [Pectobacterium parvum]UFK38113.1 hypothetical protein LOZ86_14275 [Pectobacterium parvum]UVD98825.1 hypothetical protein NV347_07455 [Pectobacterium parvum]